MERAPLGAEVHGVLTGLHGVAALYWMTRRNWTYAAVHGAFVVFDGVALIRHMRDPP